MLRGKADLMDALVPIHRHWIWANWMKKRFDETLPEHMALLESDIAQLFITPPGMYMCLWYGLLYTVCEALHESRIDIGPLQTDIEKIYANLRLLRNAVFHIQQEYWSVKMQSILDDPESASTIRRVHDGVGEWFLARFAETKGATEK